MPNKTKEQKMNKKKIIVMAQGAMIAAIYAAATYLSAAFAIAYGNIQFRLSEALTILSVFTPAAVPGLAVGCVIGNISSPFGIWDIVFGSLATLLAAITARALRNIKLNNFPVLSLIMPVIFNAIAVGAELTFLLPSDKAKLITFVVYALEVAAGELAVCVAGGIPLYYAVKKSKIFDRI